MGTPSGNLQQNSGSSASTAATTTDQRAWKRLKKSHPVSWANNVSKDRSVNSTHTGSSQSASSTSNPFLNAEMMENGRGTGGNSWGRNTRSDSEGDMASDDNNADVESLWDESGEDNSPGAPSASPNASLGLPPWRQTSENVFGGRTTPGFLKKRGKSSTLSVHSGHGSVVSSNAIGNQYSLGSLCADLRKLSEKEKVLIYLDECDHLWQQAHFQDWLQLLLKDCPNVSFLLSTHQSIHAYQAEKSPSSSPMMVSSVPAWFKNIHVVIKRLSEEDTGKLFLRRLPRQIRWSELGYENWHDVVSLAGDATKAYKLVATSPYVAQCQGHPRKLIEAAARL